MRTDRAPVDNPEITEVVRIRNEEFINGQPVDKSVVDIARDDEAIDTAVVSFFDVDYVRKGDDDNEHSDRAKNRSVTRAVKQQERFIR